MRFFSSGRPFVPTDVLYWDMVGLVLVPWVSIAAYIDWRDHRVPNLITLPLAAAGLIAQVLFALHLGGSWWWTPDQGQIAYGLGAGLAGWALGIAVLLPIYAMRAMGAGDVKLIAAIGAWFGWKLVLGGFILGAVLGGIYGLGVLLIWGLFVKGARDPIKRNMAVLLLKFSSPGRIFSDIGATDTLAGGIKQPPKLPYGVPLTFGCLIVLFARSLTLEWVAKIL